jgi:hypothetical protein
MFLTVFTSIIRSLRLYIQHQVYIILLMMDGKTVRNINLRYCASCWFYYRNSRNRPIKVQLLTGDDGEYVTTAVLLK